MVCLGKDTILGNGIEYNQAVQHINNQQLLLNLVRLRYREPTVFLRVEGVTSQLERGQSGGISLNILEGGFGNTLGLQGNVSLNESPTITYRVLQDEEFMRRIARPNIGRSHRIARKLWMEHRADSEFDCPVCKRHSQCSYGFWTNTWKTTTPQ